MQGIDYLELNNINSKKYELLAPAGNKESLIAAVQNGCNAVYISGKNFGARKNAPNFDEEDLKWAIDYCHIRDVDVFVTVNTLTFNDEFNQLLSYLKFLYKIQVDAVIVQDISLLKYIKSEFKDFKVHCSTQMSANTLADVEFLEKLGADRVVLGRELSFEQIKYIKENTNIDLEVFIHGAICISQSGQCLMSSLIGGRSGNRGECAQPCRKYYDLLEEDVNQGFKTLKSGFLISSKDLMSIEYVQKLVDIGVFSLKIEGRMKRAEYVAGVVKTYKNFLDYASLEPVENLLYFNRPFTKGFLFGDNSKELSNHLYPGVSGVKLGKIIGINKEKNLIKFKLLSELNLNDEVQIKRSKNTIGGRVEKIIQNNSSKKSAKKNEIISINFKHSVKLGEVLYKTYDTNILKSLKNTFHKESLKISLNAHIKIKSNKPIVASLESGNIRVIENTDIYPSKAENISLDKEIIKKQFSKLGNTPYSLKSIEIELDDGLFLSMKDINALRRKLIEKLYLKKTFRYDRDMNLDNIKEPYNIQISNELNKNIEFTYSLNSIEQLEAIMSFNINSVYYKDLNTLKEAKDLINKKKSNIELIPEVFRLEKYENLLKLKKEFKDLNIKTLLIQSYGHINIFKEFNLIGDFSLNITNDNLYEFYKDVLSKMTLSLELNKNRIKNMNLNNNKTEIIGYGHQAVMSLKYCLINTIKNCNSCSKDLYYLKDEMNEKFPLIKKSNCFWEVYNSKKILLLDSLNDLKDINIGFYRLNFVTERKEEVIQIIDAHHNLSNLSLNNITKGYFNKK